MAAIEVAAHQHAQARTGAAARLLGQLQRHGEFLRCPWHGWEFEIRSGQSYCDPRKTRIRKFDIKVEPGETLVKGPYKAETFAVTVEKNYLVIEA